MQANTIYERVGGSETFFKLVRAFYKGVENDPVLRPLYPEENLDGAIDRLALFLIQYFGGPQTYMETRGHPRLRMRHMPFSIGKRERDIWVRHMTDALDEAEIAEPEKSEMLKYFHDAATFMINREPQVNA